MTSAFWFGQNLEVHFTLISKYVWISIDICYFYHQNSRTLNSSLILIEANVKTVSFLHAAFLGPSIWQLLWVSSLFHCYQKCPRKIYTVCSGVTVWLGSYPKYKFIMVPWKGFWHNARIANEIGISFRNCSPTCNQIILVIPTVTNRTIVHVEILLGNTIQSNRDWSIHPRQ